MKWPDRQVGVALALVGVCVAIDVLTMASVWFAFSPDAGDPAGLALTAGFFRVFYGGVRLLPTLAAVWWCIAMQFPRWRTLLACALVPIALTLAVTIMAEHVYR